MRGLPDKTLLLAGLVAFEAPLLAGWGYSSLPSVIGMVVLCGYLLTMALRGNSTVYLHLLEPQAVIGLGTLLLLEWLLLAWVRYYAAGYSEYDTGIFAQLVWNAASHGRYYSSVLGNHGLGDHFTPALLLLTPLIRVFPSFMLLTLLKIAAFFFCPLLLYLIGRDLFGRDNRLVLVAPLLWLVHRPLYKTLLFEFQPSSLALPFILLVFLFAGRRQFLRALAALIFLLGFKEHLALIWVSAGIFIWLECGKRRLGIFLAAAGIVAGVLIYELLMPWFATAVPPHAARFGPFALLPEKAMLLLGACLSVIGLPIFLPRSLCWVLPAFGIALVSRDPNMVKFSFHYQDAGLTVLFVAVVYGLKAACSPDSLLLRLTERRRAGLLAALVGLALLMHHSYPSRAARRLWPDPARKQLVAESEAYAAQMNGGKTPWILPSLGPYFFKNTDRFSLIDPEIFLKERRPRRVIFSDKAEPYPLSAAQVGAFKTELERRVKAGRMKRVPGFEELLVFETVDR